MNARQKGTAVRDRTLACVLGFLVLSASACTPTAEKAGSRHLILVVFDTLRADRMSVYGHDRPTTPFFDEISGEMIRFADAKATAPWTVPSHASLFTGLVPAEHHAQWGRAFLAERFTTLAEVLERQDFCTTGFSANPLAGSKSGLAQGFDSMSEAGKPWRTKTERILSSVAEELDRVGEEGCRLFLFVNLMDAHIPYTVGPYAEEFGAPVPPPVKNAKAKWQVSSGMRTLTEAERSGHEAAYDASVRYLDDAARRLMEMLAQRDMLDESIVVFTSDHGDGLGQHPQLGHAISVWEEQLAVPLLVRLPGAERGGEVVSGSVSTAALTPTVLDWLGVERPAHLTQAATLDLTGGERVLADYRSYFAEGERGTNIANLEKYPQLAETVRDAHVVYCGNHKLRVGEEGAVSLFDLASDPGEKEDLATSAGTELNLCLARYRELLNRDLLTPFDEEVSEADRAEAESRLDEEALRALGYLP